MNSLDQYIELFEANRSVVESNSAAVLNSAREGALETLRRLGRLPEKGDEGYPCISLAEMFAPDYGINIGRLNFGLPHIPVGCDSPLNGRASAVILNDSVAEIGSVAEGVEIVPFSSMAATSFSQIAPAHNPVVALNSLLAQEGLMISIGRNARVSTPVQILSTFNSSQPMMAVRRIRIVVEAGARGSVLLCEHPLDGAADNLSCRVVEIELGQDASLDLYDLEEASTASRRASVTASVQQRGSSLNICSLSLSGGTTRNEFYHVFEGEGCSVRIGGMVIAGGNQIVDNSVWLKHSHPRCSSDQLFKYALFDNARGSFEGLVEVAHGAVDTIAHQTNRNLIAGAEARMYAMPQLEIYCDEVKASHGSATGQLDEQALFYMRQRGIPEDEARMMLVNAFMTDVLDNISNEVLRERLRHLVELRLRGGESMCNGCKP